MAYLDINPTETGWTTENGDFKLKNREVNIAGDVVVSSLGAFKYAPLTGGDAPSFLNSTSAASVMQRAFKVALKTAGFTKPIVDVSNYPNSIEVNNNEVL